MSETPIDTRTPIAKLIITVNTILPVSQQMQTVLAMIDNTKDIEENNYYLVENTNSHDLSFMIDTGISEGLSLIQTAKAIKMLNLTEEEIILHHGTHIANIYECNSELFLSENDPLHKEKMELHSLYSNLSAHLLHTIKICAPQEEELHKQINGILSTEPNTKDFCEQRKRIQALSPKEIQSCLMEGTLSTHEVTAHIVPCIDFYAGIGGFSKGAHNLVLDDGRMSKVFLAIENDTAKCRNFKRNNPEIPCSKFTMGKDFNQAKLMIKSFVHDHLWPFAYIHASPPHMSNTDLEAMINTRLIHWTIGLLPFCPQQSNGPWKSRPIRATILP